MKEKMNKPVAVCTKCGATTRNAAAINRPCRRDLGGGKRCKGAYGSSINIGDWEECPTCNALGFIEHKRCDHCDGDGWLYVRDKRR